ncbi:MAG: response regulator [Alphaproteobacteria bacterium]
MARFRGDGKPVTVLVAEDSLTQREQIRFLLEDQGFVTILTANGRKALDQARAQRPDILVSDVVMPEMTGFELCRAIRRDPNLNDLPVILVTSLASPTDVFLGLEAGADNFIIKPYDEKYLVSRIEYILSNRALRHSGKLQVGIEIELGGERHFITAERQQILDLLISTYEQAVRLNDEVKHGQKLLHRSYETLNALYLVAEGLNGCRTEREAAALTLDRALDLPGVEAGWIVLADDAGRLELADFKNIPASVAEAMQRDGQCACRERLLAGRMDTAENIVDCRWSSIATHRGGETCRHASVPLLADGRPLGLLNLVGAGNEAFDDADLRTFTTIGQQVVVALERIRLHRDLEEKVRLRTAELAARVRQQAAVARLSQRALSGLSLELLMSEAMQTIRDTIDAPFCKIFQRDAADPNAYLMVAGYGWAEGIVGNYRFSRPDVPEGSYTVHLGRPVMVADWDKIDRPRPGFLADHNAVCSVTIPIPGVGRYFGILGVDSDVPQDFSQDEVEFLQSVANVIGITVQREASEATRREADQLVSSILDASPVAIVTMDRERKVLTWNQAAESTFGYSTEEIVGRPIPIAGATEMPAVDLFDKVRRGQAFRSVEIQQSKKDGGVLWTLLSGTPLQDGKGDVRGAILTLEDITQRRRIEEQLRQAQKMEAIGNLTGGIAHDFNNLLNVVIGNVDLMLEAPLEPDEAKQCLEAALHGALRGADLTRQLLAFSRRQELEPRRTDVNELVAGMTKLLARVLEENVELRLGLCDDPWPVMIDPAQLDSALMNLSVNARDAMPQGGVLTIATRNATDQEIDWVDKQDVKLGNYVVLEVSDTGTGIPAKTLQHIFEPFFTTKEKGKGTGLGLAMVYGFVKQSGGHITVYSEVGHGTTFRLYLPSMEDIAAHEEEAEAEAPSRGNGELVLVVEDNASVRQSVVRRIGSLGYGVLESSSAAEAVGLLEQRADIAILFSDVVMAGGMSGLDLAIQVADRWPAVRVLLTSGYPEMVINGRSDIVFNILSKPYRQADLARRFRDLLQG